ncbi:MAG: hypothetical protein WA021_02615 [Minisyncoccia bacterium]
MADIKAPAAAANQAIDVQRKVQFPVDQGILATETGGSAEDRHNAALGKEKHFLGCFETATGRAAIKVRNLDPALEAIVEHDNGDLYMAVLTLHKELFRTGGGTKQHFPVMNGVKNELWSKMERLLLEAPKYFKDPQHHATGISWWKTNGVPLKKAVNLGGPPRTKA